MKLYFAAILVYVTLVPFHVKFAKGDDLSSEFTNFAALDEAEKVKLYWSVDWNQKTVTFAVEAKTTGWVGFGISTGRGQMAGADIVIGGVTQEGKRYFTVGSAGRLENNNDVWPYVAGVSEANAIRT